jgi:Xaa-Pro aminopeptidase
MSGQNGYGNGYGYSGPGRYDANDAYSGSSSSLGVSGYSGRSAGASSTGGRSERRPGGYGGFYDESPQPPALSPSQSSAPSQSYSPERRRDQPPRDWQQPSSQSKSRSRSRNQDPDRRQQDERSRDQRQYADNREQDRNASPVVKRSNTSGEAQAIESMSFFLDPRPSSMANKRCICSNLAIYSARLGLHDRCRVCSGPRCFESDGYKYIGQSGPRR